MKETDRARVVVVGAGFAGLHAVRRLAKARIRVLWVDGRNYHCFLPLLYQVATAGLEMAGALAEFRTHVVPRDYRKVTAEAVRIVLLEAGPDLLPPFTPRLRERARRDLVGRRVDVRSGARVTRITPDGVELATGETISARTTVWAAGIRAAPVTADLGLATGKSGRVRVDPTLRVPGYPEVFAAGDVAIVDGAERLPQVAPVAIQQGEHAAANVLRGLRGEPCLPFHYRDKGTMATIGRSRAVAVIDGLRVAGRIAWWLWLVVHLVMLIGFRNRLVVLVDWAGNYFTYDRGLRAIVGAEDETGGPGTRSPGPA